MAAPPPSRLDANQVLKGSYDEATGRLRTDSLATVVNADIDVNLDASEDSVAIADPAGHFLDINPDGSINVVLNVGAGSTLKTYYSEVTGVVSGITTIVASYMTGANDLLQKIQFSGTNIAEYELVIDGVTQDKARTYFGNSLNGSFDFNVGLKIPSGKLIEIYVVHTRSMTGDFNARIQMLEA
jgi:hypothetical protein